MVLNAIKRKKAENAKKKREEGERRRLGATIDELVARDIKKFRINLSRFFPPHSISVPMSLIEIWNKASLTDEEFGAMMREWVKLTIEKCKESQELQQEL
jgi:hypothetical protein